MSHISSIYLIFLYSSFLTSDCQSNLHRSDDHFVLQLEMFSIKWSSPVFLPFVRSSFAVKGRNTFFRRISRRPFIRRQRSSFQAAVSLSIVDIHDTREKFHHTEKERLTWKSVYIERHEALWLSPSFILPLPVPSSNRNRRSFNENCAKRTCFSFDEPDTSEAWFSSNKNGCEVVFFFLIMPYLRRFFYILM